MKISIEKKQLSDIEKIKNFLLGIGFICSSDPSAQHLIYSKEGEVVIIKNKEGDMK